jgi:hypothetical protein
MGDSAIDVLNQEVQRSIHQGLICLASNVQQAHR